VKKVVLVVTVLICIRESPTNSTEGFAVLFRASWRMPE